MALFQAKTGRDRLSVKQKKTLSFRSIPTRFGIKNSQKIGKKCEKLKKHHSSFISRQNGTGQAENDIKKKVIVPIHSNSIQNGEFEKKNSKKIQKIKKHHYGFFSSQNGTGQTENERKKKIIIPIHSIPIRNREFQKNSKKIEKK